MKIKTYSNPDNSINYGYSRQSRKWEFHLKPVNSVFLTPVPGVGEEKEKLALQIANILKGAIIRSAGVDGLARANINRLVYSSQ
jgi:hypothetical protein